MSVHQTVLCLTSEVRLSEFLLPFDLFVKCEKKLSNKRSAAIKPNIIDCSTSDLTDNCSYFELFVVLSANTCTEMAVYRIIDMYEGRSRKCDVHVLQFVTTRLASHVTNAKRRLEQLHARTCNTYELTTFAHRLTLTTKYFSSNEAIPNLYTWLLGASW